MEGFISISWVIALVSASWSLGVFVGMVTAKFVSKKDCQRSMNTVHTRIDNIQDVMAGGKVLFELRMVRSSKEAGSHG